MLIIFVENFLSLVIFIIIIIIIIMSKPLFDTPIALQHAETQPSLSVP